MCVCLAVPAGCAAAGHRERPGARAGLGVGLRRRRAAATDPGETGAGQHQDAGQVSGMEPGSPDRTQWGNELEGQHKTEPVAF